MLHNQSNTCFVINLLKRTDRREQVEYELLKHSIPFKFWTAIEKDNGAEGLYETMVALFEHCVAAGYKKVLVLEDDAQILEPGINIIMEQVLEQLPDNFDCCYLGCQLTQGDLSFYSENLIRLKGGLATHAILWSKAGMIKFLEMTKEIPIDIAIKNNIQTQGNCYVTYPMLITQRPSYSDIDRQTRAWKFCLEDRYNRVVQQLKQKA